MIIWKTVSVSYKVKHTLHIWPRNPTCKYWYKKKKKTICSHNVLLMNACSSFVHNRQNLETSIMSKTGGCTHKVWCPYKGTTLWHTQQCGKVSKSITMSEKNPYIKHILYYSIYMTSWKDRRGTEMKLPVVGGGRGSRLWRGPWDLGRGTASILAGVAAGWGPVSVLPAGDVVWRHTCANSH